MRKVYQIENGNRRATIVRNSEWNEFIVRFYVNGIHLTKADYHHSFNEYDRASVIDAKLDCISTANNWVIKGD